MNELATLKKIEQSKLAIREVKTLGEIKKLVDQSEALKAYAKSAQMSAEIQADIAELNLIATRRLGEISVLLEKAKGGQPYQGKSTCPNSGRVETKTAKLADVGVSRQRANEAEKLAKIDEGVFNDLLKISRENPIPKSDIEKVACMDAEKQKAIADKITSGAERNIKAAMKTVYRENKAEKKAFTKPKKLPDNCQLFQADIANQLPNIADNSVDYIITDPPYKKEFIPLYGELSKLASRVLKPEGSLIVMCGQSYLPEVINELCKHMKYHWCMAYLTSGGQSPQLIQKKVNVFWKPLLWFTKGGYSGDHIGDVIKTPPNDNDKKYHEWGQSLGGFKEILSKFTYPGQVIFDPFLGGGTTGVAAVSMNRKFIGADIDQKNVDVTRERILEALYKQ
jgi:site-specific DNA-methyltransferase (adenine-specific)